jgi:hypothetical protein
LDDANRANENPVGAPWTTPIQSGAGQIKVLGNRFMSSVTAGTSAQAVHTGVFADGIGIRARITDLPTESGRGGSLWTAVQHAGDASLATGYVAPYLLGTGTQIYKMVAGGSSFPTVGPLSTHVFGLNDYILLNRVGADLVLYSIASGLDPDDPDNWNELISVTDVSSPILGPGSAGIEFNSAVMSFDDVEIVQITVSPLYTASGYVKIPSAYDGTDLRLESVGFGEVESVAADMTRRDVWQRPRLSFRPTTSVTGNVQFTEYGTLPTNGVSAYFDGLQVEVGERALPFELTSRTAGYIGNVPASLIDEVGFAALFRVTYGTRIVGEDLMYLLDWRDDADNLYSVYIDPTSASWEFVRRHAGVQDSISAPVGSGTVNVAVMALPDSLSISINGEPFVSAAGTHVPTLAASTFQLGASAGALQFDGRVHFMALMKGILTDADVSNLNSILSAGRQPVYGEFPSAADVTATMPMVDGTYYVPS